MMGIRSLNFSMIFPHSTILFSIDRVVSEGLKLTESDVLLKSEIEVVLAS